ncbi:MAG: hypothetical protein BWY09_03102 [Candidatus Hydrogenedentes bacterium ADurb.Bin179]|nr:MAG: hypothetical protein BWY09_03102 [Candidatus Hydrogenedentes bacterium ADurb.Bin179]
MVSIKKNGNGCATIFIGPAGWSYPDWKGIVYPETCRHPLTLISQWMDLVEINVTYYRPIAPRLFLSWLTQAEANPKFRFAVKAPARLTHERGETPDTNCAAAFRDSLNPLVEPGKLGAVLLQFPWSFKRTPAARTYLGRLADLLHGLPLCVEMRHHSWAVSEFFDGLRERGIAFCNIDQPGLKDCIAPSAEVTAPFAYVRLHGRNAEQWFKQDAGRDDRYNYLYSKEELAPWVDKIMAMQKQVNDLYIVTNNHYQGKAIVNALELQASFGIFRYALPETLLQAYPRLKEIMAGR